MSGVVLRVGSHSLKGLTKWDNKLQDISDRNNSGELSFTAVKNNWKTCVMFTYLGFEKLAELELVIHYKHFTVVGHWVYDLVLVKEFSHLYLKFSVNLNTRLKSTYLSQGILVDKRLADSFSLFKYGGHKFALFKRLAARFLTRVFFLLS